MNKKIQLTLLSIFICISAFSQLEEANMLFNRGKEKINFGNYTGAIEDFDKSLALIPDRAPVHTSRGMAYEALGNFSAAISDYTRSIALDPTYAKALNCRGMLYASQKKYKEAMADYEAALKAQPTYATVYINRGKTRVEMGDTINACNDFKLAETYGVPRATKIRQMYCKD